MNTAITETVIKNHVNKKQCTIYAVTGYCKWRNLAEFVLNGIQQYAILAKADRMALENKLMWTMSSTSQSATGNKATGN